MATSQKSTEENSQTLTCSWGDSLAKLLALLESEEDLKIPEGRCSLTLHEYCRQKDLDCSSLKMLKDFSITTVEKLSEPSSRRLMNWGMIVNGKCLTARISASPKTEKELSLLEILEEHPDPKYSLSESMKRKLLAELNK